MANPPVSAESTDPKVAGVRGENSGGGGFGVWGFCNTGHGVHGDSTSSRGVVGTSRDYHGVFGASVNNVGVAGESQSPTAAGVLGSNDKGGDGVVGNGHRGVVGTSTDFRGVSGHSTSNTGVFGESNALTGVWGESHSAVHAGVFGLNASGGPGLAGNGKNGFGVWAHSDSSNGVYAESTTGIGLYAKGGKQAGYFEGNVVVTGDLNCPGADFAEDFDVSGGRAIDAGTVMVLGEAGALSQSTAAYDHRVAGVISGAGSYRPGIVLDRRTTAGTRQPVALVGKVFCKVDATFGAIGIGDLLTTSDTPGHAMKTTDAAKAFGAVIGKALAPHGDGCGLIPILVSLQ